MLDIVAGQHDDRSVGRQPASQQRRANPAHVCKDLRVTELAPISLRVALRKEHAVGRSAGPMLERVTELAMVFAKRLRRADVNDAIGAFLKDDIELAEPDRPQRRGGGSRGL